MNKDALLATLIGFGIGLLITGLLLVGPNLLSYLPKINWPTFTFMQQKTATPTIAPTPKTHDLSIESPLADAIETTPDLLVSGTAPSGTTVIIAGPGDESVVVVAADNKFAGKLTLVEGKNTIMVTALGGTKPLNQTVTVYYTQETL